MTFGERLKIARKKAKMSQNELAKKLGTSRVAITNYELNNNTPTYENTKKLSEILKVDLMGEENTLQAVCILSYVSCGDNVKNAYNENVKVYINQDDWSSSLYALKAKGFNMTPEIYDGDICIIDPKLSPKSGDLVHFKTDEESVIKVFIDDKENELYHFIPFSSSENFKTKTIRKDVQNDENELIFYKVVQIISYKKSNSEERLKILKR